MPYLCPATLTAAEQKAILRITREHPRTLGLSPDQRGERTFPSSR